MSGQRQELLRLVEEEVPAVLDNLRPHLRSVKSDRGPRAGPEPGKARQIMPPACPGIS